MRMFWGVDVDVDVDVFVVGVGVKGRPRAALSMRCRKVGDRAPREEVA